MEKGDLRFLGRRVTGEDLSMIQEIVTSCGGLTRMELASTVCELLGWKRRSRSLKARECREFLEKLDAKGLLMLPEKRAGRPVGSRTEVPVTERGDPGAVPPEENPLYDIPATLNDATVSRLNVLCSTRRLGECGSRPA